jgi:hypothetical protein
VGDPRYLVIELDFDAQDKAESFRGSYTTSCGRTTMPHQPSPAPRRQGSSKLASSRAHLPDPSTSRATDRFHVVNDRDVTTTADVSVQLENARASRLEQQPVGGSAVRFVR